MMGAGMSHVRKALARPEQPEPEPKPEPVERLGRQNLSVCDIDVRAAYPGGGTISSDSGRF